jgi:hypothetical protein
MPPQCQAIQDQITVLEGEIQSIEDELNNAGSDTPIKAVLALAKEAMRLNRQLSSLQKELVACLLQN